MRPGKRHINISHLEEFPDTDLKSKTGIGIISETQQLNIPLCTAAEKGDIKGFFKLLKKKEKIVGPNAISPRAAVPPRHSLGMGPVIFKPSVNDVNYQLQTPLHIVSAAGNIQFVQKLLKHKAINANAVDKNGWTPCHFSCNSGHHEVTRLLLENGASLSFKSASQSSPLHYFVRHWEEENRDAWLEVMEMMLLRGASVNDSNEHGVTPLHEVASYGVLPVLDILIQHKANVQALNK